MFHRVKSEAVVAPSETNENEVSSNEVSQKAEVASQTAARAQNSTTISAQQQELAIEKEGQETVQATAVAQEEAPESTPTFSPAQSLYQRPAGGYSPRPAVSGFAAPKAPLQNAPATAAESLENDRRLTIGRGITMSGEIESCDELLVEGTVEAALKGAKMLNISESGVFYGTVEIQDAVIAGRFEGEIIANGRITIEETGVVTGSITYKELEISSGAIIDGRMTPIAAQAKKDA